ncbi:MAG: hypothetical protein WBE80_01880 [Methylocella sp.]
MTFAIARQKTAKARTPGELQAICSGGDFRGAIIDHTSFNVTDVTSPGSTRRTFRLRGSGI